MKYKIRKERKKLLEKFIQKINKIPEIIAMYYTGSTASGNMDKYSDIDIDLVVEDNNLEKIFIRLPNLLRFFGKIKFCNTYKNSFETYAYLGEDYLKVEIDPIKKSSLKPNLFLKNIKIIFDREGTLTRVYKKSLKLKKPKIKLKHKEIISFLLSLRDSQIYAARHYARGFKFSAKSELDNIGGDLFWFLAEIKGMRDYELLRSAERDISEKEKKFLDASRCKSLDKKEIKRTAKASWEFMKYLEKEYEQKTKRKLNLKTKDNEIVKLIDKMYLEVK